MYILIALGYVQRVYPNTHCSGISKSKGLQWFGANATLHETVCIITYGDLTEALTQQMSKQAHGLRHSTPENSSASRVNSVTTLEPTEPLMSKAVNYHHLSYEYVEEQSD